MPRRVMPRIARAPGRSMAQSMKNERHRHRTRIVAVKKLILIVLVIALIFGVIAVWLVASVPRESAGVAFPLNARNRALIASVPATADSFAIVPTVAAVEKKLVANPATRAWAESQEFPQRWILGGADLVAWRTGKSTTILVQLDPLRAFLARMYLMIATESKTHVLINTPQ